MSPKQGNRENSPYTCACNFHLISTHMQRYSNFDGVSLQNRDQGNNHTHIYPIKLCIGVSLKTLQELEQAIR
jgi:hypothetical protein